MSKRPNLSVVWAPWQDNTELELATSAVVIWLAENAPELGSRLTVVPNVNAAASTPSAEAFSANGNILTHKNRRRHVRGGPVLAYVPDDEELSLAVPRSEGNFLGLVAFHQPALDGFAAATKALNVLTGEHDSGVSEEIDKLFVRLDFAGYKGFPKSDAYVMRRAAPIIEDLLSEGLDADFIVTYALARGLPFRHAKELRELLPKEPVEDV